MLPAGCARRSASRDGIGPLDKTRDRPEREIRRLVARHRWLLYGVLEQPGKIAGHDLFPGVGRRQQGERLATARADRRHRRPQSLGSALSGETRVEDDQGVPQRGADEHEFGEELRFQGSRDRIYGVASPDPMCLVHLVRMPGIIKRNNIIGAALHSTFAVMLRGLPRPGG